MSVVRRKDRVHPAKVGAISIANYMWATVEERYREIGTLLGLGSTRGSSYRLFVAKSIFG